jgi:predicted nucleotidyltransferase component of viral defense system
LNISRLHRIKLDLTFDEPLILDPIIKEVTHPYSDKQNNSFKILSYSYEEIFAEKLRALMQRLRPRDLYDVIHLHKNKKLITNRDVLKQTLIKKCEIRSTPFPTFELINHHNNRKLVESEWSIQLRHQLSDLPPFADYLEKLKMVLNWLTA